MEPLTKKIIFWSAVGITGLVVGRKLYKHFGKTPQTGGIVPNTPTIPQPPPVNDHATPGKDTIPGKTVYAATDDTHTWTSPVVDPGYLGGWLFGAGSTKQYDIPKGNIAGWIVDGPMKGTDPLDNNKWYKIRVYTVPPDPALVYGYVRADVITIK